MRIWLSDPGRIVVAFVAHAGAVTGIAAIGADRMASCGVDGVLRTWDITSAAQLHALRCPGGQAQLMCMALIGPDSGADKPADSARPEALFVGGSSGSVVALLPHPPNCGWDGDRVSRMEGHYSPAVALTAAGSGAGFASAGSDGVRAWGGGGGGAQGGHLVWMGAVLCLAGLRGAGWVVAGSADGHVIFLDGDEGGDKPHRPSPPRRVAVPAHEGAARARRAPRATAGLVGLLLSPALCARLRPCTPHTAALHAGARTGAPAGGAARRILVGRQRGRPAAHAAGLQRRAALRGLTALLRPVRRE